MKDELFEAKHTLECVRYWAKVYTCPNAIIQWVYSWAEDDYYAYKEEAEDPLVHNLKRVADDLGLDVQIPKKRRQALEKLAKEIDKVLGGLSANHRGLQNLVRAFEGRVAWLEVAESLKKRS